MLSTSTWVIILIIMLIIKYVFIQPHEDSKIFKMYAARDNLALKAIRGKVCQDSREFAYVMDTVNFNIYYTKNDYDFFIIFKNIFKKPLEDRIHFEKLLSRLKKNEYCYETYINSCIWFIENMNLRVQIFVFIILKPVSFVLYLASKIYIIYRKIINSRTNVNSTLHFMDWITSVFSVYKLYQKEKPYSQ